jgi:hypothetical protein
VRFDGEAFDRLDLIGGLAGPDVFDAVGGVFEIVGLKA